MRIRKLLAVTFLAALVIVPLSSCEKDEQEASKSPRSEDLEFKREFSEMVSFQLQNGATVYMQEEYTKTQVAIELFFRAGFAHEPAGKAQVSHLAEHCAVFAPTESYEAGEAIDKIHTGSIISAEAVGDFVHFSYVVRSNWFEEVLKSESERLTSIRFTDELLEENAKKAAKEITNILHSDRGSLSKFGLITMLQAALHDQDFVPVEAANFERTTEEVAEFHAQRYRTDDMVLVIVGGIKIDEAKPLVEKYFGSIPRTPEPPRYEVSISEDMNVGWDIDAKIVFLVYPGPFGSERERAALVMFGSYLNQFLARSPEIPDLARATYTTNPLYPVNNLPFFVFAQTGKYRSQSEMRDAIIRLTDQAIASVDESVFSRIKTNMKSYVKTSFLEAQADAIHVEHYIAIGQHAENVAIKHYLKMGKSDEEYLSMVESITFEEMQQILAKYLSQDQRHVMTLSKR